MQNGFKRLVFTKRFICTVILDGKLLVNRKCYNLKLDRFHNGVKFVIVQIGPIELFFGKFR